MNRLLPALAILLAVLLGGCRVSQPLGTPSPSSAAFPSEPVAVQLSDGLRDLVWRWDTPGGAMPAKPEGEEAEGAEFQRRFDRFCADTGIVAPGEPALLLEGDILSQQSVRLISGSRAWLRVLELNAAIGRSTPVASIAVDLLVLEVPADRARQWGLDGLPAAGDAPALLQHGLPSNLGREDFATLRSLILDQAGGRVFAAANLLALSGVTAFCRQVSDVPVVDVGLQAGGRPAESSGEPTGEESRSRLAPPPTPTMDYAAGERRDVGIVFEATTLATPSEGGMCQIAMSMEITGLGTSITYSPSEGVARPLITSFSVETEARCPMGQTILLGSTLRAGEAGRLLTRKSPRPSCLLAFVTPRWSSPVPGYPVPENFCSPAGQLLVMKHSPGSFGTTRRRAAPIRWGDDDDDDAPAADDDGDQDSRLAGAVRWALAELGVDFGPESKVVCVDSVLSYFGSAELIQHVQHILKREGILEAPLICQATAVRIAPEQWTEVFGEQSREYGPSSRVLKREEADALLRGVAQNRQSAILAAMTVPTLPGKTSVLRDVVELPAPESYQHVLFGSRSLWLPVLGDARELGASLEVTPTMVSDGMHVALEVRPEYTAFEGWQPCGPTLGLPQFRASTTYSQVLLKRGQYLLLGGGGGGPKGNPFVIWLVGVN